MIINRDLSAHRLDRVNKAVACHGGDYFLTLGSFMGFENALLAMYEEPDEVMELFDYVLKHYLEVMRRQIQYVKPFHKRHADLARENGIFLDRHDCGRCERFIDDWLELGIRSWNPAQVSNDLVSIKKKYAGKLVLNGCWDNQGLLGSPTVDLDFLREALYKYVDTFAPGGTFVFSAMIMADPADEEGQKRTKLIKDFYFDYVRDYYNTH